MVFVFSLKFYLCSLVGLIFGIFVIVCCFISVFGGNVGIGVIVVKICLLLFVEMVLGVFGLGMMLLIGIWVIVFNGLLERFVRGVGIWCIGVGVVLFLVCVVWEGGIGGVDISVGLFIVFF